MTQHPTSAAVRYTGTHPKRFEEKYKELDPVRHADAIQKVMDRGQTPAGMHRPICVTEILDLLRPQPGEMGLDATMGFGGHSQEIPEAPDARWSPVCCGCGSAGAATYRGPPARSWATTRRR
jgi:hypothetical protein